MYILWRKRLCRQPPLLSRRLVWVMSRGFGFAAYVYKGSIVRNMQLEFLCCSLCSWCVSYGNIHTSYRRIRSCFRFLLVRKGTLEFLIFVGFQRSAMPSLQKLANVYYRESFVFFGFWLDFCRLPKIGSAAFSKCCECLISKKSCAVIVGFFVLCATRSIGKS